MQHNRATIYSNGIADFQRVFPVEGNKTNRISIPVRQQHLGDVLASLTISGSVKIESPPSYQPANQDDGNITISTGNALTQLAHQLAGADVSIAFGNSILDGKLVGIQDSQVATGGEPVTEQSLVVMTNDGFSRVAINQIESMKYVDEAIQTEIDKALSRRLRDIKPNSTFVDLELSTQENSTTAIIQYTIPAAAWKISYRVLIHEDRPIEFHGHAIVDNNTDEDWKDFVIAVVMGQPITFTTDLADSKTPSRSHVNIVQESAIGAVEVEEAVMSADYAVDHFSHAFDSSAEEPQAQMKSAGAASMKKRSSMQRFGSPAEVDEAEITETGDFCIFESANPVSIAAHRSAVIPVFATTLDETKPVLHFKTENHSERPFRALRFKNTTTHSLGRGVCTVYDGTTFAGSCILPATKPGAESLLPHALETAVKVDAREQSQKSRRVGIRVSEGFAYNSTHNTATTQYYIHNSRNESFQFLLDHDNRLRESKIEVSILREDESHSTLKTEELKNGRRADFELRANDHVCVEIVETSVSQSRISLTGGTAASDKFRVPWLIDNIVNSNTSLSGDPSVLKCIKLQKQLDELIEDTVRVKTEIERLAERQNRLRENIKTGSADQQTARWQSNLAKAEDEIVQLEDQLPELRSKQKSARNELFKSLKGLALEWKQ
jgi:hypothetical protein